MKEVYLENISKRFDREEAVKNLTLKVDRGRMISLLGPSGCGKSTTLKIIAGLVAPEEGRVFIGGDSVNHLPTQKRGAVIVFQDHRLFPHMTVGGNVEFGLRMQRMDKKLRREKVREMLRFVGLQDHGGKYPAEISGGQQQRVAIARSLVVDPKVLLLDEPFSNLDQRLKEEMRSFIVKIQRRLKITTILVTHDKEDALITSEKIGVMFNGELKQYGTPEELYENPASLEVARFFGEVNRIPVTGREGEALVTDLGVFPGIAGDREFLQQEVLLLRPEGVVLQKKDPAGEGPFPEGRVLQRVYAGEKTYYRVSVKDLEIMAATMGKGSFYEGDSVAVKVLEKSLMVCKA